MGYEVWRGLRYPALRGARFRPLAAVEFAVPMTTATEIRTDASGCRLSALPLYGPLAERSLRVCALSVVEARLLRGSSLTAARVAHRIVA